MDIRKTKTGIELSDDFDRKKTWQNALSTGVDDICNSHNAGHILIIMEPNVEVGVYITTDNANKVNNALASLYIRHCEEICQKDPIKTLKKIIKKKREYEKR